MSVPVYSVIKTLADVFRPPELVNISVAIESRRAALDQRRAMPGMIAEGAQAGGAWKTMQPYLEALSAKV